LSLGAEAYSCKLNTNCNNLVILGSKGLHTSEVAPCYIFIEGDC